MTTEEESAETRRLGIAIAWHGVIMTNPSAMTLHQRLIGLKTAFEALLDTSDSREAARRLRHLFEEATVKHREGLPWIGILWSPAEKTALSRSIRVSRTCVVSWKIGS